MPAGILSLALPLALDGESLTGNGTAIAALSIISIVGGYLVLFALWYFVFRDKSPKPTEGGQAADSARPEPPDKRPSVARRRGMEPPARR
jgi:hypothetical protein